MALLVTFDTSLSCSGVSVWRDGKPIFITHVKGGKYAKEDTHKRVHILAGLIIQSIYSYVFDQPPNEVQYVFELPVVSSNAGGTIKLGFLIGATIEAIHRVYGSPMYDDIKIGFANNQSWKKIACGNGHIKPEGYFEMAKRLFPEFSFNKVDEAAAILMGDAFYKGVEIINVY